MYNTMNVLFCHLVYIIRKFSAPRRTSVLENHKEDTDFGFIPDYTITPTIQSYITGEDFVLIKAINRRYQ